MLLDGIPSLAQSFLRKMGIYNSNLTDQDSQELERSILLVAGLLTDHCESCNTYVMKNEINDAGRHKNCGGVVTNS